MKEKASERIVSSIFKPDGSISFQAHHIDHKDEETLVGKLFLKAYSSAIDSDYIDFEEFGARGEAADIRLISKDSDSIEFQVTRTLDSQEAQKNLRDQILRGIVNGSKIAASPVCSFLNITEKQPNLFFKKNDLKTVTDWFVNQIDCIVEKVNTDVEELTIPTNQPITQRHTITCEDSKAGGINSHSFDIIISSHGTLGTTQAQWVLPSKEESIVIAAIQKKIDKRYAANDLHLLVWGRNTEVDCTHDEIAAITNKRENIFKSIYYLDIHYAEGQVGGYITRLYPERSAYDKIYRVDITDKTPTSR